MVQMTGLEPVRDPSLPPEDSASATSATSAYIFILYSIHHIIKYIPILQII